MFTGIVEAIGTIETIEPSSNGLQIKIDTGLEDLKGFAPGDSVSVSGICLTAEQCKGRNVDVFLSNETIMRSRFFELKTGDKVNIERPLTLEDGIGGHVVSGHVDGLAECTEIQPDGASLKLVFFVQQEIGIGKFIVKKGSIAIDGVSMTVNEVEDTADGTIFSVNLIPYTRDATTLGSLSKNQHVHIEVDMLARYVARLLENYTDTVSA